MKSVAFSCNLLVFVALAGVGKEITKYCTCNSAGKLNYWQFL